jgi:hypothetical protein
VTKIITDLTDDDIHTAPLREPTVAASDPMAVSDEDAVDADEDATDADQDAADATDSDDADGTDA